MKYLSLVFSVVILTFLVSCGNKNDHTVEFDPDRPLGILDTGDAGSDGVDNGGGDDGGGDDGGGDDGGGDDGGGDDGGGDDGGGDDGGGDDGGGDDGGGDDGGGDDGGGDDGGGDDGGGDDGGGDDGGGDDGGGDSLPPEIQLMVDEYLGSHVAANVREVFGATCDDVSFSVTQNGRMLTISQRRYRCQGNSNDNGVELVVEVQDNGDLLLEGVVKGSVSADELKVEDFKGTGNCSESDFIMTLIDELNSSTFDFMCKSQYTFVGDL